MLLMFGKLMVVASPIVLLAVLGLAMMFRIRLSEKTIANLSHSASACGMIAALSVLVYMLATGIRDTPLDVGDWVSLASEGSQEISFIGPDGQPVTRTDLHSHSNGGASDFNEHFHFQLKFTFDRLSIPFAIMSLLLCGVIGAFAFRYMHLEAGFNRFFLYYSIFQVGMVVSSLAGTIETLFFGWELVGLSSALLVAFFHDRPAPVKNGLRVWAVYRVADAAFLVAALTLHHLSGTGDFDAMTGNGDWPLGVAALTSRESLEVGFLLLIAAAGKSALVPFSGWLPRAMEGPTPSSAVFYGALSVHLGAFLLLRVSPMLDQSALLSTIVFGWGAITMIYASLAARVQSDVKCALSYASLVQVSIIMMEIGCGLRYIPLIHIIGHACVRTLQLVRAPSLLKDLHAIEDAIGDRVSNSPSIWRRWLSDRLRLRIYRFSWERGYLDSMLDDHVVRPFVTFFQFFDRIERKLIALVGGQGSVAFTFDETADAAPDNPDA